MMMMWKPRTCDIKDKRRMLDNLDGQTDFGDDDVSYTKDKEENDEGDEDDEHMHEIHRHVTLKHASSSILMDKLTLVMIMRRTRRRTMIGMRTMSMRVESKDVWHKAC